MKIRIAQEKDSFALSALLTELGYENTESFIAKRLKELIHDRTEQLLIAEDRTTVLGFPVIAFRTAACTGGRFCPYQLFLYC